MKTILIIYPHWMPSNLVGAQRARLLSRFFEEFGWNPIVLAVDPACYNEPPVDELVKLVKPGMDVRFVKVNPQNGVYRWFGDLTLRGFKSLRNKAIEIIRTEKIDFVWLPIPSFYNALLGRPIHKATGVPYGIDYIDPWVNGFAGQERVFSKAWISNQLAKVLEPYAVKNASLISGVTYEYYSGVLKRNFKDKPVVHCAMQYGFDPHDYDVQPDVVDFQWDLKNELPLIYAGAFLPKSHLFVDLLFGALNSLRQKGTLDPRVRLHFFGTGHYLGKGIMDYAREHDVADLVIENRDRLSYLQILQLLKQAHGIMVIGSTQVHYSASKVFQALLSGTPVFSIFHRHSEAAAILKSALADDYTALYDEKESKKELGEQILDKFEAFLDNQRVWNPDIQALNPFSSKESARILVEAIDQVVTNTK